MPFSHTCRDHPGWSADTMDHVLIHVGADHPGVSADRATRDGGPIESHYVPQVVAQGHVPLRIFLCPCGSRIETRDPDVTVCVTCAVVGGLDEGADHGH